MDCNLGPICSCITEHLGGDAITAFNELPPCQWLEKILYPHPRQFKKPLIHPWVNAERRTSFPQKWGKLKSAIIQQIRATVSRIIKRRAIRKNRKQTEQRSLYDAEKYSAEEKLRNTLMKEF